MMELEEASTKLFGAAVGVSVAARKVPDGVAYTRQYAVNPVTKRRAAQVSERLWSSVHELLQMNGFVGDGSKASDEAWRDTHTRLQTVLEAADIMLRRVDRARGYIPRGRKRAAPGGEESGECDISLRNALRRKIARTEAASASSLAGAEEAAAATSGTAAGGSSKSSSLNAQVAQNSLYRCPRANFDFAFVPTFNDNEKPHSLEPLDERIATPAVRAKLRAQCSVGLPSSNAPSNSPEVIEGIVSSSALVSQDTLLFPHPYQYEIGSGLPKLLFEGDDVWGYESTSAVQDLLFKIGKPTPPIDIDKSPPVKMLTCRDDVRSFVDLVLSQDPHVLAVDVEHHGDYSYHGYTCLIQMTYRGQDYILDPATLDSSDVQILNDVFTCPLILKVLHGAKSDILWLQRDFSIYIVNLFDTHLASQLLALTGPNSLASLVQYYCGVILDKTLQRSDWRTRPLSDEQIQYARADTHYLPYIFECQRNQILGRTNENMMNPGIYSVSMLPTARGRKQIAQILQQSSLICLQQVSFGIPNIEQKAARITSRDLTDKSVQVRNVLVAMLAWREWEARKLDVAPFVLGADRFYLSLATKPPRSRSDLFDHVRQIPPLLKGRIMNLLSVINYALDHPIINGVAHGGKHHHQGEIGQQSAGRSGQQVDEGLLPPSTKPQRNQSASLGPLPTMISETPSADAHSLPADDHQSRGESAQQEMVVSRTASNNESASRKLPVVLLKGGFVVRNDDKWAVRLFAHGSGSVGASPHFSISSSEKYSGHSHLAPLVQAVLGRTKTSAGGGKALPSPPATTRRSKAKKPKKSRS